MYIYPLSRIHNTSLVSAYFGQDKRECECLEYLYLFIYVSFIIIIISSLQSTAGRKPLQLLAISMFTYTLLIIT
jgi:hypothetical protein